MSTQSPNFNLVIATTSDQVNVVTQISNNFSTLDTVLSYLITSTGAMKPSVFLPVPQLSSPTITGSMTGMFSVTASTGMFNTVTCTSGNVTFGYVGIGTYSLPTTLGATGQLLTVVTGSAQWAANAGGSGAATNLGNLASVAINTNMNSFTASAVTMAQVIATSGSLTGLTVFQATTGTFSGNVTVTGTLTANAIVCTGGMATFSGVAVGTYSLPSTLGTTGQVLQVVNSTLGFASLTPVAFCYLSGSASTNPGANGAASTVVLFSTKVYDPNNMVTTGGIFTATASGIYKFNVGAVTVIGTSTGLGGAAPLFQVGMIIGTSTYVPFNAAANSATATNFSMCFVASMNAANTAYMFILSTNTAGAGTAPISVTNYANDLGYFVGEQLF